MNLPMFQRGFRNRYLSISKVQPEIHDTVNAIFPDLIYDVFRSDYGSMQRVVVCFRNSNKETGSSESELGSILVNKKPYTLKYIIRYLYSNHPLAGPSRSIQTAITDR